MEKEYELSNKDFEAYIERIRKIAELSSPLIDDMRTSDEYLETLSGNFREIGGLAKDNRQMIADKLAPILDSDVSLSDDTEKLINEFYYELVDAANAYDTDVNYAVLLTERLLKNYDKNIDTKKYIQCLDKLIECYSHRYIYINQIEGAELISLKHREIIIGLYQKMMYYTDRSRFNELDEESKCIVMTNSRYGIASIFVSGVRLTDEQKQFLMDNINRSISFASDPFYLEALPEYNWQRHRLLCYYYILESVNIDNHIGYNIDELNIISEYIEKAEKIIADDNVSNSKLLPAVKWDANDIRYLTGKVSKEEYKKILYNVYINRDVNDFSFEHFYENTMILYTYLVLINKDAVSEKDKSLLSDMYNSVTDYLFRFFNTDIGSALYVSIQAIIRYFIEFSDGLTIEAFVLDLFAAIHPPTYIHSNMVAKITCSLTHHLLKADPALFVGVCGCPDKEHVPGYAERIEDYAYHAALCHDFGKIYILNVISTYGRKILDSEFELIKRHPTMGAFLLEKHSSTKEYADVAKGHHLWYNAERGYPTDFDAKSSPVKTIIDIVACADCMDAATDKVGRSYNSGKTLDEYIEEVREGSGTHYAPYLYELMKRPEVYGDIEYLLDEGRKATYRETYLLLKGVREKAKTVG